jgi:hypothetical protein
MGRPASAATLMSTSAAISSETGDHPSQASCHKGGVASRVHGPTRSLSHHPGRVSHLVPADPSSGTVTGPRSPSRSPVRARTSCPSSSGALRPSSGRSRSSPTAATGAHEPSWSVSTPRERHASFSDTTSRGVGRAPAALPLAVLLSSAAAPHGAALTGPPAAPGACVHACRAACWSLRAIAAQSAAVKRWWSANLLAHGACRA